MTEDDFDRCPACGTFPKFGLRSHPKFSIKVVVNTETLVDIVPYYAHTREHIVALRALLVGNPAITVISLDEWDGEQWVEFFP
jgi:hypothetical protein